MSNYQFFASSMPIKEYDNLKVKKYDLYKDFCLIAKSPLDESRAMRIIKEEDLSLVKPYTDKSYCNYIEWLYNEENANIIVDFIKEHLQSNYTIELWNTWFGDYSNPEKYKIPVNRLQIKDIKKIWGKDYFDRNECLIVYKEYS